MSNPYLRPPRQASWFTPGRVAGIVLGVVFLAVVVAVTIDKVSERGTSDPPEFIPSTGVAIQQCENQVSDQLKAPSTAQFDLAAESAGSDKFTVTGTVDSQNSFGAMTRNDVQCSVRFEGETAYTKVDLLG